MMKLLLIVIAGVFLLSIMPGCNSTGSSSEPSTAVPDYPKIASWLAQKDEIIANNKPYDLVMTAWFTPEEAEQIKTANPEAILLAGLSVNWVWDNDGWMTFLLTVANYGREQPFSITEDMYLQVPGGGRCAFGWASEEWQHEEIYAMDPRNPEWIELITSFYETVLEQPQHDGIIVDMVLEKSWCPEAISDQEWVNATRAIMAGIDAMNTMDKLVIFNAGKDIYDIDAYAEYMDGYVMENFMGDQIKSTFADGLQAADDGYTVIYAVDTDDTGIQDLEKMRLGLTLSMLNDNTYFTYDFGPRDHGQSWWFTEYDMVLGNPLGGYYENGNAYYREFENGLVVAAPYSETTVSFNEEHVDITSGVKALSFSVNKGDGRIFVKPS